VHCGKLTIHTRYCIQTHGSRERERERNIKTNSQGSHVHGKVMENDEPWKRPGKVMEFLVMEKS